MTDDTLPRSDYAATNGVAFFARLLDKLRLRQEGRLPNDYNFVGCGVWDCFDARFCRFFGIDERALVERVRAGGSDEEILAWCCATFGQPNEEKITFWNSFVTKRGWFDESSEELASEKRARGWGERADIQTWVDFHDADEGRTPRAKDRVVG